MAMLHGPDDVLGAPRGISADKHAVTRGLEGGVIHDRHVPFVELDADITLDPREGVVLPDREDYVVAGITVESSFVLTSRSFSSGAHSTMSNSMPTSRPSSITNRVGE